MNYNIKGKEYTYTKKVRDTPWIREGFNGLVRQTFGFDFKPWHGAGFWGEHYIPHLLLDGERAVANVSVNVLPVKAFGQEWKVVQLGTVMTEPEYRGRGLSRFLMEMVKKQYDYDMMYLYANDNVLDFYPRFGFSKGQEYEYAVEKPLQSGTRCKIRQMDMAQKQDQQLLYEKAKEGNPFSEIQMQNRENIMMFYALLFEKENIYFLEEEQLAAVIERKGSRLFLKDIFGRTTEELDQVIRKIAWPGEEVVLGFAPKQKQGFRETECHQEDTTLFVLDSGTNLFEEYRTRFPVLSQA